MPGLWLLGVPARMRTIKEGKLLTQQIQEATQAGASLANTAQQVGNMKPNLLLPGAAAIGAGLLGSKIAADKFAPRKESQYMQRLREESVANFIFFDTAAMVENGLATTIHAVRNAGLKKKLNSLNNANELARAGIEAQRMQQMKGVPTKLAGIGLGTAAIATPTMMYMNNKYNQGQNN